MEKNKNSGIVEPIKSTENKEVNNTPEQKSEVKDILTPKPEEKKSKIKNPREIFFGGEKFPTNDTFKSNIQNNLDNALPGAFVVQDVDIQDKEVSIAINRHANKFYQAQAGCISLDDAILITGHLQKADKHIPLPLHPFANQMNYHFSLDDLKDGYNQIMGKADKIKDILVTSDPFSVTYHYKF